MRFLLKLATTIELKQGLEPSFSKLLRMRQLVLLHTHWQAHQRNIERDVCSSGFFPSLVYRSDEQGITIYAMHWLIKPADQVIGGAVQMAANIKIQKTGAEVASYAEAMPHF